MMAKPFCFYFHCVSICMRLLGLVLISHITSGEVVHIEILTLSYTSIEDGNSPVYQCYRSHLDLDATLEIGRTAPIPSSAAPDPPQAIDHPSDPTVQVVTFPTDGSWGTDGFGAFYCNGSKPGRDVTVVSTFFKRGDAKFVSSDGVFTRTVNAGDTGVLINMTAQGVADSQSSMIRWRKDGGNEIEGSLSYTFANPIQSSDQGIYEIYLGGERGSGRGGLYRLIVRDCPSGKWGPPECHGICDKCYNGGVCDDQSGLCICPINFIGPNCLDTCRSGGGNRHGLNCEYRCTRNSDPETACHGYLFCLPDPLGCTCDVGIKGHACDIACDIGEYGPGCSQTCHCQSGQCDRYTGECADLSSTPNLACEAGWTGGNCQVPDMCDAGYFGPMCIDKCHCLNDEPCNKGSGECSQRLCAAGYAVYDGQVNCTECIGAFFGLRCLQPCHCVEGACDKVTGLCNGQCLSKWLLPDCQAGIASVESTTVNPFQPSTFTCYVQGDPPAQETDVNLYRVTADVFDSSGIVRGGSNDISGSERAVRFIVETVVSGHYLCVVTTGGVTASLLADDVAFFVLPVLDEPPRVSDISSNGLRIEWTAWTESVDEGDPPVVEYAVFTTKVSSVDWREVLRVGDVSTTLSALDSDTDYEFSVAAVRDGPGGTGPRSPAASATTLCSRPTVPQFIVTSIEDNVGRQLTLTWQSPDSESANCRSGFTHYTIYYSSDAMPNIESSQRIEDIQLTEFTLTGLETFLAYSIYMTASNKDDESGRTEALIAVTPEEVAPPPSNVRISRSGSTTLTVEWSAASPANLNGDIERFEVKFTPFECDESSLVTYVEDVSLDGEYTLEGLTPGRKYSIEVRIINGAGNGEWSTTVHAQTIVPDGTCNLSTTLGLGVVMGISLLGNIITVSVVLVSRIRRGNVRGAPTPPVTKASISKNAGPPVPGRNETTPSYQDLVAREAETNNEYASLDEQREYIEISHEYENKIEI